MVVNDLGSTGTGTGASTKAADVVVAEIVAAGGEAIPSYASVEDGDAIVKTATDKWGRIDILINNAGILRDASFQKLTHADWDLIYRVHLYGTFACARAAWNVMRDQGYARPALPPVAVWGAVCDGRVDAGFTFCRPAGTAGS